MSSSQSQVSDLTNPIINDEKATRSAKSGNDWTPNDLITYNTEIHPQEAAQFFDGPLEPFKSLDPNVFLPVGSPTPHGLASAARDTYYFLTYLRIVTQGDYPGEMVIAQFLHSMLAVTGYEDDWTQLNMAQPIPFNVCGARYTNNTGVSLITSESYIVLLVCRASETAENVTAQVIADAIGAFQNNNARRAKLGLPSLHEMDIPCVTIVGTRPTFFKVPVTEALSKAVISGEYPETPTIVTSCAPPAPSPDLAIGMDQVDYRRICLEYCNAFLQMAKKSWAQFLTGVKVPVGIELSLG